MSIINKDLTKEDIYSNSGVYFAGIIWHTQFFTEVLNILAQNGYDINNSVLSKDGFQYIKATPESNLCSLIIADENKIKDISKLLHDSRKDYKFYAFNILKEVPNINNVDDFGNFWNNEGQNWIKRATILSQSNVAIYITKPYKNILKAINKIIETYGDN